MRKNNLKTEEEVKFGVEFALLFVELQKNRGLSIFKSNKHVYLQLINDLDNLTITSVSTKSADLAKRSER
jgi:large subunit ribosomal protein L18